ncbi:MAG: metallophosphoesterase family protein [Planctomycetota bacterium]
MYAIISDIHGNLEALLAVLDDIKKRNITEIICLGDIIGYGPNPKECIDIALDFQTCILGNHDEAALFESEAAFFNDKARAAIEWTRQQLEDYSDAQNNGARWDFLCGLPRKHQLDDILMVHGSPRKPVKEYIFPDIIITPNRLDKLFELIDHTCFVGHTHIPGVITEDREYKSPAGLGNVYEITGKKAVINFGSVGQPRDGINTAAYGCFDGTKAFFCRVPYDIAIVQHKIYAIGALDNELGDRLAEGR